MYDTSNDSTPSDEVCTHQGLAHLSLREFEVLSAWRICQQTYRKYIHSGRFQATLQLAGLAPYDDEVEHIILSIVVPRLQRLQERIVNFERSQCGQVELKDSIRRSAASLLGYQKPIQTAWSRMWRDFGEDGVAEVIDDAIHEARRLSRSVKVDGSIKSAINGPVISELYSEYALYASQPHYDSLDDEELTLEEYLCHPDSTTPSHSGAVVAHAAPMPEYTSTPEHLHHRAAEDLTLYESVERVRNRLSSTQYNYLHAVVHRGASNQDLAKLFGCSTPNARGVRERLQHSLLGELQQVSRDPE